MGSWWSLSLQRMRWSRVGCLES